MTPEERARLKELGKDAFIREEMTRLGYWPPSPEAAEEAAEAESRLEPLYREVSRVRRELQSVDTDIANLGNIEALLAEVRRARIERVRAAAAAKREEKRVARETRRTEDARWRRATLPHLGRGVSEGLRFEGGDPDKVQAAGLPALATATDVADALGIGTADLAWLCYERPASGVGHYARFTIPKKKGGLRVLSSPKTRLRRAQSWIRGAVLGPLSGTVHAAATAFRPGKSVVDNAAPHRGREVLVRMDLKDFFPSLDVRRVRRFFVRLGYNEGVASILALLCTETPSVPVTFDGARKFVAVGSRSVPQGACTSPDLTNLLARRLDARLDGAARSLGFAYTRYADDLTFSHPERSAPVGALLTLVRKIVAEEKLTVNEEKTQVLRPSDRQAVTGLVVNGPGSARVSREDLRRFRALLHQCEARGLDAVSASMGRDAGAYARGYLAFVHMARPATAATLRARHPWLGGGAV